MCHYFSLSQLNATAKFSQVFMLTQNKTIQWVFLVSVFGNCGREVWVNENKSNGFSDSKNEYEGAF